MATSNPLPNREEELAPHLNETQSASAATPTVESRPFVMPSRAGGSGGKDKTRKMSMIAGAILVLLVVFFGFVSTKGTNKKKTGADAAGKPNLGRVVTPNAPGQLVPADKMAVQNSTVKTGSLEANDIEKTKSPKLGGVGAPGTSSSAGKVPATGSRTLADVAQFQQPNTDPDHLKNWSPEAYPGTSRPTNGQEVQVAQKEQEEYSKPSMIFVAHETNGTARSSLQLHAAPDNFGLESGYHVAARLESMASTTLHAPVTAVIEYNYQRDGRVLIPAGSRAVGKITQADASGIMNIEFSSIELPDNGSLPISAIAATTSLQAIKGQVTGKNAGKSIAVRSLAGLGQAGAMLVGQGSVNGAVSESDLIRQRAAENMGSGADAQVMSLLTTQHIVVSVPAGTEIYLIFTKPQRVNPATAQNISVSENTQ